MEQNPMDWAIIPLDEDALADGAAMDERHRLEKLGRPETVLPPEPIQLSFSCRGIAVTSYLGALKIAHNFEQVTSLGTLYDFPEDLFSGHPARRRLRFDDLESATPQELTLGIKLPEKTHVQELFAFADRSRSILIHCYAGISRSPAMAILLAWHWGCPMDEILAGLNPRKAYPNKRILALGEEIFHLESGGLVRPIHRFLAGNAQEIPSLPAYTAGEDGVYRIEPGNPHSGQ